MPQFDISEVGKFRADVKKETLNHDCRPRPLIYHSDSSSNKIFFVLSYHVINLAIVMRTIIPVDKTIMRVQCMTIVGFLASILGCTDARTAPA